MLHSVCLIRNAPRVALGPHRPEAVIWLAALRVVVGLMLALEQVNSLIIGDWRTYVGPRFHPAFEGLPALGELPVALPVALWVGCIGGGLAVALGWRYRLTAPLLAGSYWLLFLLDATEYVNHFYLYCLLATALLLLPAHRSLSLDIRAGRARPLPWAPAWWRWALVTQVGLVYFFGGIAKLHADWFAAAPLAGWLTAAADWSVLGAGLRAPWVALLLAWGGVGFDLAIVPALLWRRTRPLATALVVGFHVTNALIFGLATFPWAMLLLTLLFFPPRTLLRNLATFRRRWRTQRNPLLRRRTYALGLPPRPVSAGARGALILYFAAQVSLPLRHYLLPGEVNWHEAGHRFAWHMMLRAKGGSLTFRLTDSANHTRAVDVATILRLTPHQFRKLALHPDLLLQTAHALARAVPGTVAVYADSWVQLNARAPQPLVRPDVNLLAQPRRWWHPHPWVTPAPAPQKG